MVTAHFVDSGARIVVEKGTTIMEAARRAGILIESPCNGVGTCGKCKVRVPKSSLANVVQKGRHSLSAAEEAEGYVLSCEAELLGDVSVELPQRVEEGLKIIRGGKRNDIPIAPFVTKRFDPFSGKTLIYAGEEEIGREDGDTAGVAYGAAVDIGTTTLVVALVDLITGKEVASASGLNPQSLRAQDVLSRIRIGSEEQGLEEMRHDVIGAINSLIMETAEEAGIPRNRIYEAVFSGNTCMLHLATGVNPASLGKYPYSPIISGGTHLTSAQHRLSVSPSSLVYLPPIISGYVGADITAGILSVRLHEEKGTTLFVDIGTNGEMAIAVNGRVWTTSTAAGPAFEGMNITFGMRAGKGAIERFTVIDGAPLIETIGGTEPAGICGSGLIDIVAELVEHGVITPRGTFASPDNESFLPSLRQRLTQREGKTFFLLSDRVYLTQKDIRQIQLAKGAIRAGIDLLLRHAGIDVSRLDNILIAGSFGYHLREKSLLSIGLLPKEAEGKVEFVGNTSKSGAEIFLLNALSRQEMDRLVKEFEAVELANCGDFDKVFVNFLQF